MDDFIILIPALNPPRDILKSYLYELRDMGFARILLVNDGTSISSNFVYKRLKDYGNIETEKIIEGLKSSDKNIVKYFSNVMEDVVYENFPHLYKIKNRLENLGAAKALLSGSGASIFAVFFDEEKIKYALNEIKNDYKFVERVNLIDD